MTTLLIANNCTHLNGQFMGDQLCYLKTAYLFAENTPGADRIVMSMSPGNEMAFLWDKFIDKYKVEVIYDRLDPGDNIGRWQMWDRWRAERTADGVPFDHYRELYLRIHGHIRQPILCGEERGSGRRNIYEYLWFGQENMPEAAPRDVDEWTNHGVLTSYSFGDDLIYHPSLTRKRDVYISPHAKTQGNYIFTFEFWEEVVHRLIDYGLSVTVGYNGAFCEDMNSHPLYRKCWGSFKEWMEQVCQHRCVACGNTGTGWLAAACGVPMVTMEPPNSQMPDHRYRECGLRNIAEVIDHPDPWRVAMSIVNEVQKCVVMTTGCYDILHAGHVRHLERSRALGTRLVVALNSDSSVNGLKGHLVPARPINPQDQRRAVLEALRCVDEVRVFDGPDATDLIREVRPSVLTAGFGYTPDKVVGREIVEEWGGRVVITCQGDAKSEPSTTKIANRLYHSRVVELCRLAAGSSVNPFEKLRLMADQFLSVKELPGDVADLGAWRGGTSFILRKLSQDKRLHIFDTWAGTPIDDPLCHHKKGEWAASIEDCKTFVGEDPLTFYHEGCFPDTVEDREFGCFCFVYVDMDTEQATHDAIEFFWPRLVPGGKILIDDYGWEPCAGVKKAVDEFFLSFDAGIKHVFDLLYACMVEKK